jgi:hypothetical protein
VSELGKGPTRATTCARKLIALSCDIGFPSFLASIEALAASYVTVQESLNLKLEARETAKKVKMC